MSRYGPANPSILFIVAGSSPGTPFAADGNCGPTAEVINDATVVESPLSSDLINLPLSDADKPLNTFFSSLGLVKGKTASLPASPTSAGVAEFTIPPSRIPDNPAAWNISICPSGFVLFAI